MIVYKITNTVTGRAYIGITSRSARRRFQDHIVRANGGSCGRGRSTYRSALHAAIQKYGVSKFNIEEIARASDWSSLQALERTLIVEHATYWPGGYNLTLGGEGAFGVRQRPETIAARAAANRGKKRSTEVRARLSAALKGKPKSREHIEKMRHSKRGHKKTPEQIERSAAFHRGRKRSPETRARISASLKGLVSPLRGVCRPQHVRDAISKINKGRRLTPDQHLKLCAAQKARWQSKRDAISQEGKQ